MARKPENALTAAIKTLRTDVADLRERRLSIMDRIAATAGAPITEAEMAVRVDAALDLAAHDARDVLNFDHLFAPDGRRFEIGPVAAQNPLGLLVMLGQRDTVRAALLAEAKAAASHGGKPLGQAERDAELVALRGELSDAERAEEIVIREAEEAGVSIPRRRDADPALFLAEDL